MVIKGESEKVCIFPRLQIRGHYRMFGERHHHCRDQHTDGVEDQIDRGRTYLALSLIII